MVQGLRALAIPPKVLSSVPNTHIIQLITACNSSTRALSLPSGLCTHTHIVFINSINHMYTLKELKEQNTEGGKWREEEGCIFGKSWGKPGG